MVTSQKDFNFEMEIIADLSQLCYYLLQL